MPNNEVNTINSVLLDGDIKVLFAGDPALFPTYGDVWDYVREYYNDYRRLPTQEIIKENFSFFEVSDPGGAAQYYLDNLRDEYTDKAVKNLSIKISSSHGTMGNKAILSQIQKDIADIHRATNSTKDLNLMDFDAAERHYEQVRLEAAANGGTPGIPSGISFVDANYPIGLSPGHLVLLLGYPARGKSLFSLLLAVNAHARGKRPMIFSAEMSEEEVRDRAYTLMGRGMFSNSALSLGEVDPKDFNTLRDTLHDANDFIVITADDFGDDITPNAIQGKIDEYHPDMFIGDYAQIMSDNERSADMVNRMRNLSKQCKRGAKSNHIPYVLISSATPKGDSPGKNPPMLEDVAWSKQLAYDADLAATIHRFDNSNYMGIIGRKNRHGDLFDGVINWDIDNGILEELDLRTGEIPHA